jgi:hypothetical protein
MMLIGIGDFVFLGHTIAGSGNKTNEQELATGTGSDWSGSLLWQTSVTAMLQGLPEKAPCNILPEQEFDATTITESAAASQNYTQHFGKNENCRNMLTLLSNGFLR